MSYLVAKLIHTDSVKLKSDSKQNLNRFQIAIRLPEDFTSAELHDLEEVLRRKLINDIKCSEDFINSADIQFLNSNIDVITQKTINFKALDLSHFFRFNNWVKIRSGVYDRYLKMNSSNFIGRIVDFYNDGEQDIFYILWSKETLESLQFAKLQRLMTKKISPFGTYVSTDLITPIVYQEDETLLQRKQLEIFYTQIANKYSNEYDKVFGASESNTDIETEVMWEHYFSQLLSVNKPVFCFFGSAREYQISDIVGGDQKTGVWVELSYAEKNQIVPLSDLDGIKENKEFSAFLAFYKYWAKIFCY